MKEIELSLCQHGFSFGYCPDKCIKFCSLKEKIAEERRLFLKEFKQTPRKLEVLQSRKRLNRMPPITKITFITRLLEYNRLEKLAKY